jgi:hypothetical protein
MSWNLNEIILSFPSQGYIANLPSGTISIIGGKSNGKGSQP